MLNSRLSFLASLTLGLIICACSKQAPQDHASATASALAITDTAPFSYKQANADVSISLDLDPGLKAAPVLHTHIFDEAKSDLDHFMSDGQKNHASDVAMGLIEPAFYRNINWHLSAQSPKLLSVYAEINTNSGGAHPNFEYTSLIWDRQHNQDLKPSDLFMPQSDLRPMDAILCQKLNLERAKRTHEAESNTNCPKLIESRLTLSASTMADKIGGISVLFAPYEAGSYAEGAYEITLPQSQLRSVLRPDILADFDGEPAPKPKEVQ